MSPTNNLCGIECEFLSSSDVWILLASIDFAGDSHYFSLVDASIYHNGRRIAIPNQIDSDLFRYACQQSLVAERLVLHVYPVDTIPKEIDTYSDFLQTSCAMIILIYDCCFLEIYCKNQTWIEVLWNNARKIPGAVITKKYPDSDSRTIMYV